MARLIFTLTFLLAVAYVQAKAVSPSKWKCTEADKKKIDTIVARIMTYGRTDRLFPVNKDELKVYCKESTNLRARLDDYKETCLKGQSKQIVGVIVYSINALNNLYCKNPNAKRTKDLIASASCANKASTGYKKCNDNFVDLLYGVYDTKDSKKRLAQMCCGYHDIFKCVEAEGKKVAGCTEPFIEANKQYIHGFFDNAITLLCGEYGDNSDKCDHFTRIKAPAGKKFPPVESYFHPLVYTLSHL